MLIQLVIQNEYGEFRGTKVNLSEDKYLKLLEMVKTFYVEGGFELNLEDGSFVVFPPDVVQKSILKIEKIKNAEDVQK